MNRRRWGGRGAALALAPILSIAACSSDKDDGTSTVTAADAYVAAIRWYLGEAPPTTDTTKQEPLVVFVAPASGEPIDVQTQADVAAELADMDDVVVVSFADVRDDAIEVDVEGQPVKDDGVLLLVGPVTQGASPVEVDVGVYRGVDDERLFRMLVTASGESFVATSVTEVEQG